MIEIQQGQPGDSRGRINIQLGPVERWVVAIVASAAIGMAYLIFNSVRTQLNDQGRQLTLMATAQAVMATQLSTLSIQLADVPALTRTVAENRVRIDQNTVDIKRLQDEGHR